MALDGDHMASEGCNKPKNISRVLALDDGGMWAEYIFPKFYTLQAHLNGNDNSIQFKKSGSKFAQCFFFQIRWNIQPFRIVELEPVRSFGDWFN